MSILTSEILAVMTESHLMYGNYNQKARSDTLFMSENGHPFAKEFVALREFFDSLSYASNASARWVSYSSKEESAYYFAPELDVAWYPRGALQHYGSVYPSHAFWKEYLGDAARIQWDGAEPMLNAGSWTIRTKNTALIDALRALDNPHTSFVSLQDGSIQVSLKQAAAMHWKVLDLVTTHQNAILPKRTPELDESDTAPLPLHLRKFTLANVEAVTLTDRAVLVPLIPLTANQNKLMAAVTALVALLEKGYPFSSMEAWLNQFLKPKAFKDLKAEYSR